MFRFCLFQYDFSQFMLEILLFTITMILSLLLIVLLQREKFFLKHLHFSCFSVWLLLTFFCTIPIFLQRYPSLLRFIGMITFTLITIHTTLPIERSWTVFMGLITSIIHCFFVLFSHDLRDETNKSHRMEFKLEVQLLSMIIDRVCREKQKDSYANEVDKNVRKHCRWS